MNVGTGCTFAGLALRTASEDNLGRLARYFVSTSDLLLQDIAAQEPDRSLEHSRSAGGGDGHQAHNSVQPELVPFRWTDPQPEVLR